MRNLRNIVLLALSYAFYAFLEWKMLPILVVSTALFFYLGRRIERCNDVDERQASWLTTLGTCVGIVFLVVQLTHALSGIIALVGVSFFTFKLISYIIEIHRKHIPATNDFVAFALYVAFFPTMLSGPIDRPKPFLQQLAQGPLFLYPMAVDGMRQILWGLLKKYVVADSLATFVALGWGHPDESTQLALVLVGLIYPLQLYFDFSGYSDMAIGVAKVLGINVAKNFNYPFFARNMADYWRRWHMSLTSWLTDYVFMPLNIRFRDYDNVGIILACVINLVTVGLWHGLDWTYLLFGLYHGLLFIPLVLNGDFASKKKVKFNGYVPPFKYIRQMLLTYLLVAIGMLMFRASNIDNLWQYLSSMIGGNEGAERVVLSHSMFPIASFAMSSLLILYEWFAFVKKKEYAFQQTESYPAIVRYSLYMLIVLLFFLKVGGNQAFIYAQF